MGAHRPNAVRVAPLLASLAMGLVTMGSVQNARAADAEPSASSERIRSAAEEYDRGRRAFVAGTYEDAAVHFENAYSDAPRAEALRNAVRARRAAKQGARAATLASLAAARYPEDAPTMALVRETLSALTPQLYEVRVACEPACGVAADGHVVSFADATQITVYVDPGAHALVVSWTGDRTKQVALEATAGGRTDLHVIAPAPNAPVINLSTSSMTRADDAPRSSSKPLGPAVFVAGAILTAVGVAATIVSGVDAQSNPGKDAVLRDCVGQGESCPTYQQGKSAELRTNVLLGATAGVGVLTAVVGIFFTRWTHGEERTPRGVSGALVTPTVMPYVGAREAGLSGRF